MSLKHWIQYIFIGQVLPSNFQDGLTGPKALMENRRSISNSSLKAGKAVRLVWPQPQVLNMLGLHGDQWEGWLVGMLDMSVQTLWLFFPWPPVPALFRCCHPGSLSLDHRPCCQPSPILPWEHLPGAHRSQRHRRLPRLFWSPRAIPSALRPCRVPAASSLR